jgi:hypothetical protein
MVVVFEPQQAEGRNFSRPEGLDKHHDPAILRDHQAVV